MFVYHYIEQMRDANGVGRSRRPTVTFRSPVISRDSANRSAARSSGEEFEPLEHRAPGSQSSAPKDALLANPPVVRPESVDVETKKQRTVLVFGVSVHDGELLREELEQRCGPVEGFFARRDGNSFLICFSTVDAARHSLQLHEVLAINGHPICICPLLAAVRSVPEVESTGKSGGLVRYRPLLHDKPDPLPSSQAAPTKDRWSLLRALPLGDSVIVPIVRRLVVGKRQREL